MRFQDWRVSRHFVLSDFLCGLPVLQSGTRLAAHTSVSSETMANARHLAETLLEPTLARLGPVSLGQAWVPEPLATTMLRETGKASIFPQKFTDAHGAQADTTWHHEIRADRPPLNVARMIDATRSIRYERLLAHGSQLLMGAKRGEPAYVYQEKNGSAASEVYERGSDAWKVRRAVAAKTAGETWESRTWKSEFNLKKIDWHRCRVSPHLMVTDFAFDEARVSKGHPANIPMLRELAMLWAEVLDPVKLALGHITVTHVTPTQAVFLMPQDSQGLPGVEHPAIVNVEQKEHPSETIAVRLTVTKFAPRCKHTFMDGTFAA